MPKRDTKDMAPVTEITLRAQGHCRGFSGKHFILVVMDDQGNTVTALSQSDQQVLRSLANTVTDNVNQEAD